MVVVFLHGLTASGAALFCGIFLDDDVPPVDAMVFPSPPRLLGLILEGVVGVADDPLVAPPSTSPILPLPSDDDCARWARVVPSPLEGTLAMTSEGGVRLWSPCLSSRGDRLEDGDGRTGMAIGGSIVDNVAVFGVVRTIPYRWIRVAKTANL